MMSRHSYRKGVVLGAVAMLLAAACTRNPPTPTTTTRPNSNTTTTVDHTHGGHGTPGSYDHPPTQEQLTQLRRLVTETRTYARAHWPTLAQVNADRALNFIGIGDGVHYSSKTCRQDKTTTGAPKPHIGPSSFGPGYDTFDWTCPESLVVQGGRVAAVMYQLPDHMGFNDVPDMGGNLTQWHSHPLCFGSNDPNSDAYYRIGGALLGNSCSSGFYRGVAPMIHVWINAHPCGPFAGTVRSEGSCVDFDF
jgi:hypothetical protein